MKSGGPRTKPDEDELAILTTELQKRHPCCQIKFLWNVENSYRFRINQWNEDGIELSKFVVAEIDGDGRMENYEVSSK